MYAARFNSPYRAANARSFGQSAAAHGTKYSPDFRVTFTSGAKEISPWHDIPLVSASGAHHFICEMPRGYSAFPVFCVRFVC